MKLYNTLTRTVEDIKPLQPPTATVYTCGPTVYDYAHIGHWFTYVRADLLIRTLRISGLEPVWVMNITDVGHLTSDADDGEDKLEKGARREGKTAWEVAEFYAQDFLTSMEQLGILRPNRIVKATEHITEQIELIQRLESKGYTYTIDDGVYYDTSKFEGYAAFARLDLDNQQGSGRVAVNPQKRNLADFALWKLTPGNTTRDMEWDSPWGKGFPGWHIECSAMSMKYLGETLDIHTGGIDHVPVHHTNEIAQSESATGKRFAHHWMHSNHVMIHGEKISKSLGNGVRLQELVEQGISPEAIRLHILESHYRSQSQLNTASLEAAGHRLQTYYAMSDQQWQPNAVGKLTNTDLDAYKRAIQEALADDLNTPLVLAKLSKLQSEIEAGGVHANSVGDYKLLLKWLDEALGLKLAIGGDISKDQKALLAAREAARQSKNWAKSDEVRDKLMQQNIGVRDTSMGQVWFRLERV